MRTIHNKHINHNKVLEPQKKGLDHICQEIHQKSQLLERLDHLGKQQNQQRRRLKKVIYNKI